MAPSVVFWDMPRPAAFFLLLAATWLVVAPSARADSSGPCERARDDVVIDTGSNTLFLCREGQVDGSYAVNLGREGVGKRKQGDQKTPLGRYRLSPPRASVSGFTWFVPIGYPTAAQKRKGYTGGAIGVHGPPDWMPQPVVDAAFQTPWTDGCVMVRTTAEMEAIRAWLLEHRPRWVHILAPAAS